MDDVTVIEELLRYFFTCFKRSLTSLDEYFQTGIQLDTALGEEFGGCLDGVQHHTAPSAAYRREKQVFDGVVF